jgi:hypothetical protein
MQESLDAGRPMVLRIPAGRYLVTGANGTMPTIKLRGGTIIGDGPHASYIILDRSYSGDLFSWSEAWMANNLGPPSYDVTRDATGPTIVGLQITGSTDAPRQQNAFVFYDRNDHVLMRDIEVDYLNGQCLSVGRAKESQIAYMRESSFFNLKCWNTGTASAAAVDITSTTRPGSDATNELDFFKLAVFASKGAAVAIRNPNGFSATRRIRFFGLRAEVSGRDAIAVGDSTDKGQVADIDIYDLTVVQAGGAALRISAADDGRQPYHISVVGGTLGPGNRIAVAIDNGRLIDINLANVDAAVVLGSRAGADISIRGNGTEYGWNYIGALPNGRVAAPLNLQTTYGLYGLPNAGRRVGAAALRATTSNDRSVRLTMDGKAADAYNCFNPKYKQALSVSIQLMAQDMTVPDKWYAWSLPIGVLSAWTGPESATWSTGPPATLNGSRAGGAQVSTSADSTNGCLSISFTPPPGNTDTWEITALIHFASVP